MGETRVERFCRRLGKAVDIFYLALVTAWSIAFAYYVASIVVEGKFLSTMAGNPYYFLDYVKYYVFGLIARSPESHSIYNPHVQWRWLHEVIEPARLHKPFYSEYPPVAAPVLAPVSYLPLEAGYLVWIALSIAFAIGAAFCLGRKYGHLSALALTGVILADFASMPSLWGTLLGQMNWLMVGLVALCLRGAIEGRWLSGGLALGLLALKPQYLAFFAIPALAARRWKLLALAAGVEIVLVVLAAASIGWDNVAFYPGLLNQLQTKGEYMGVPYTSEVDTMISIRYLVSQLLPPSPAYWLSLAAFAATAIGIFCLWRRALVLGQAAVNWTTALTVIAFLLVSPYCLLHYCVLMVLPAVLTLPAVGLGRVLKASPLAERAWAIALWSYPLIPWLVFLLLPRQWLYRTGVFLVLHFALMLIGSIVVARFLKMTDRLEAAQSG